jgi:hypothetical protein
LSRCRPSRERLTRCVSEGDSAGRAAHSTALFDRCLGWAGFRRDLALPPACPAGTMAAGAGEVFTLPPSGAEEPGVPADAREGYLSTAGPEPALSSPEGRLATRMPPPRASAPSPRPPRSSSGHGNPSPPPEPRLGKTTLEPALPQALRQGEAVSPGALAGGSVGVGVEAAGGVGLGLAEGLGLGEGVEMGVGVGARVGVRAGV